MCAAHHGHDHCHGVGAEPGQGLARHLSDGGDQEQDADQDHHHAEREQRHVDAGQRVTVPDTTQGQRGGAQVPGDNGKVSFLNEYHTCRW